MRQLDRGTRISPATGLLKQSVSWLNYSRDGYIRFSTITLMSSVVMAIWWRGSFGWDFFVCAGLQKLDKLICSLWFKWYQPRWKTKFLYKLVPAPSLRLAYCLGEQKRPCSDDAAINAKLRLLASHLWSKSRRLRISPKTETMQFARCASGAEEAEATRKETQRLRLCRHLRFLRKSMLTTVKNVAEALDRSADAWKQLVRDLQATYQNWRRSIAGQDQ